MYVKIPLEEIFHQRQQNYQRYRLLLQNEPFGIRSNSEFNGNDCLRNIQICQFVRRQKIIMDSLFEDVSIEELRDICRMLNLPVSGLRNDVIGRIRDAFARTQLPEMVPVNPSRTVFFRTFLRRTIRSQPIVVSNSQAVSNASSLSTWANDQFEVWWQRFGQMVRSLPSSAVAVLTGFAALLQIYSFFGLPDVNRVEFVMHRNPFPWC